jgi:hypothetical protein
MTISITDGTTTINLPELDWEDEFAWNPVTQRTGRTLSGALWVHSYGLTGGRPITLRANERSGWMTRATLLALQAYADVAAPASPFVLSIHGTDYDVVFDHEKRAIEAQPVVNYAEPIAEDHYVVTLRFLAV